MGEHPREDGAGTVAERLEHRPHLVQLAASLRIAFVQARSVLGRLLLDGQLPASGLGLFVSGRASFELVQKAWATGFSTLLAVSAPTALAVHTARRAGLVLAGFVRGDRMNVYAPERVAFPS